MFAPSSRRQVRARIVAASILSLIASSVASEARAEGTALRLHGQGGVGHALSRPQSSEFGLGGGGNLGVEIAPVPFVGLLGKIGFFGLTEGDRAPSGTRPHGGGSVFTAMAGPVFHPFGKLGGWLGAGAGVVQTADFTRFGFDANVGWDFAVTNHVKLGPWVSYNQIVEPNDSFRPDDARVVIGGLHVAFDAAKSRSAPAAVAVNVDRDGDGESDSADACPDVPGEHSSDTTVNGCPPMDSDGDHVPDRADACPSVAGVATQERTTNGCPPGGPDPDRDRDGIPNFSDACPDTKGPAQTDPTRNGCPLLDRDNDGVADEDDACPMVPGLRSNVAKENGCPKSVGDVHLKGNEIAMKEMIFFDNESPRVKHASYPLLQRVAQFIQSNSDVLEVDINGHADQRGSEDYNLLLSQLRAESVKRLLVQFGVDATRLTTHAYGLTRPRTNATDAQNRRVEFSVTRARAHEKE